MENRFGLRDVVLCVLLIVLIVSVWLAMKQDDRQHAQLREIRTAVQSQADELKQVRRLLADGARARPSTDGPAEAEAAPGFGRIEAARQAADYAPGDWLIRPVSVAIGKLTPFVSSDVYQRNVEDLVLEPLARRDPETLAWVPLIARSWAQSEDGLTIAFVLRPDVRFADGQPLTAHDVVYTYDLIMDPKIAAPRERAYYERVTSVVAENDHRVVFRLREPYFKAFEICAGLGIMPRHYYEQFSPGEFNELPGLLYGSGPYVLPMPPAEWKPGSGKVEVVRNERYWGVPPAFDRVVFREITDETARLVTFRNGEVDVFGPTPEQYKGLRADEQLKAASDWYEYESITGGYRYVAWNQLRGGEPTFFADRRVRLALTMLTDRQRMCDELMVGLATTASGPFHRLGTQSDPSVKPWPYDAQRARALLAEAGFADRDDDGVIESADGRPLRFKLIYPASSANYKQMALFLKDSFARAGVVLEPDPLEWTIMLQRIGQRDFDAMSLGWSGTVEGDPYQIFHSDNIGDGGDNYVGYRNTELDALIVRARVTLDEPARMDLWHQVHRLLHEDQPYTFLFTSKAVVLVDKRLRNVQRVKLGLNPSVEWFVPAPLQKWGQ